MTAPALEEQHEHEGHGVGRPVPGGGVGVVVEGVGAEAGEGERHDEARADQQRPPAHAVAQHARHQAGRQLRHGRDDGAQVRRQVREHRTEDRHRVEVEGDHAGEPAVVKIAL